MSRFARVTVVLVVVGGVVACASPEATRQRAGGSGADVGNRRDVVLMHEGAHPYHATPRAPGIAGPDLRPARQAARLSQP